MKQGIGVGFAMAFVGLLLFLGLMAPTAGAAGEQARLWQDCESGSEAGRCEKPRGIAVDRTSGEIFVVDEGNRRINQFTIWGVFVKAWGWGVRTGAPELQTCTAQTGCQSGSSGVEKASWDWPWALRSTAQATSTSSTWSNRRVQKFDPNAGPGEDEAQSCSPSAVKSTKPKPTNRDRAKPNATSAPRPRETSARREPKAPAPDSSGLAGQQLHSR